MAQADMPIAVVGAGTVGSIMIAHLIQAGYEDVAVVDVPSRIDQIRENGIQLSNRETLNVQPTRLFTDVGDLADQGIRHLIVATKVTDLATLSPRIAEIHKPGMWVVSFQNGIGTENFIGRFVDPMWVARATVNFAGVREEDTGDIALSWFLPPNYLGPWQEQPLGDLERLASLLSEVGLDTRAVPRTEMKRQTFLKTILNAALNALCATTGLTMSQAMRMNHTRFLARQLLREGLSVATQMGYHYGEDVLEICLSYLDRGGNHYPSMWSDLQRGRRTEIDFINGKIVKIGMMFGHVSVEKNMFFTNMVMTREILAGVRREDEVPPYMGCAVRLCY